MLLRDELTALLRKWTSKQQAQQQGPVAELVLLHPPAPNPYYKGQLLMEVVADMAARGDPIRVLVQQGDAYTANLAAAAAAQQ